MVTASQRSVVRLRNAALSVFGMTLVWCRAPSPAAVSGSATGRDGVGFGAGSLRPWA